MAVGDGGFFSVVVWLGGSPGGCGLVLLFFDECCVFILSAALCGHALRKYPIARAMWWKKLHVGIINHSFGFVEIVIVRSGWDAWLVCEVDVTYGCGWKTARS